MKNRGAGIRNGKLRGEWAEICFMARAAERGLHLNKPWGEMRHYDFVVGHEGRFLRVQVKSTTRRQEGGYCCNIRSSRGPYVGDAFDVLAILVIPEDVWYIIPADKIRGQSGVMLRPQLAKAKYERYKEAWDVLRTPSSAEGNALDINACAAECATPQSDLERHFYNERLGGLVQIPNLFRTERKMRIVHPLPLDRGGSPEPVV